jgi:hypothetical protein
MTTVATLLRAVYVRGRYRALCSPLPPGIGDHPYWNEHEHTENYRHRFGLLSVKRVARERVDSRLSEPRWQSDEGAAGMASKERSAPAVRPDLGTTSLG